MSKIPSEWHGWARMFTTNYRYSTEPVVTTLHIGPLPSRKRIALYRMDGGLLTVLAYFRDEATARLARDALNAVIFGGDPTPPAIKGAKQ